MKSSSVDRARKRGLTNVTFLPQGRSSEVGAILAASDALLVPLSAHPTFEQFVPSKMIDYMAVGRPVVLSAAGESVQPPRSAGAGIAVAPESPDDLAAAIRLARRHPTEAAEAMGPRGRAFATRRLRSTQAERLEQVLFEAVGVYPRGS